MVLSNALAAFCFQDVTKASAAMQQSLQDVPQLPLEPIQINQSLGQIIQMGPLRESYKGISRIPGWDLTMTEGILLDPLSDHIAIALTKCT